VSIMKKAPQVLGLFVGILLFSVGLLVGQQTQRSKFDKYLRPTSVTQMQLTMLEANIKAMKLIIPDQGEMGLPDISYDDSCRCFAAVVNVSGDLMKRSLDEVSTVFRVRAVATYVAFAPLVPELPRFPAEDFKMTFTQSTPQEVKIIAEFTDGKLVFR
jgi:hypothetical protein